MLFESTYLYPYKFLILSFYIRFFVCWSQYMNIVVIGSGVIGLLQAYKLLKLGHQVTILEKNQQGFESSWAGGGIVSPMYPWRYSPAVTALAQLAQAEYPLLAKELFELTGIDVELIPCGMLMLETEDRRDALVWGQHTQQSVLELNQHQIMQLSPHLAHFKQSIWLPHIANVRNPRLLQALLVAVEKLGVKRVVDAEVIGFIVKKQKIVAVKTVGNLRYQAEQFVLATGAWTAKVALQLNLVLPIHPIKGQMLLYKLEQQVLKQIVLHQGHYLIPRADGHILCGSTVEDTGFDKTTNEQAKQVLMSSAQRILPLLAAYQPIKQWAGLRPASPNGIPFIGKHPAFANLWINAGQFRNGLVLAPASAQLLIEQMLGLSLTINPMPYQVL